MLQSFAIKKLFEAYGKVEIINFSSVKSHQIYDVFPKKRNKNWKTLRNRIIKINALRREAKGYNNFKKHYLGISGKEYFSNNLNEISNKYDILVVGSDQVWNVVMYDFDEAFFAYWTDCKKIAYAPSLGGHDIREHSDYKKLVSYIMDFSCLSVREKQGQKCLEEITGKNVDVVLDPTLAINEEEWSKYVGAPLIEGDYIFYYSWAYNTKALLEIVSSERNRTGFPVYVVDARKWIINNPKYWGYTLSKYEGPLAFLNLMYYAKKCYVESFHGMIFAYLFKKDFWLLDTNPSIDLMDARLKDLVELLNVKDRVLTPYNVNSINQDKQIIYDENKKLGELKIKSCDYIRKSLS